MRPVKTGKGVRMTFSRQKEVLEMPNLIEVQKDSYKWFLDEGLKEVFDDISPIADYGGKFSLEFIDFTYDAKDAKYTIAQCKERDVTYAAPLKVKVRLCNKDKDEINEHEIFMGDLPLMTDTGSFVINGAERVIVSQLVRSPGIYYAIAHDTMEHEDGFTESRLFQVAINHLPSIIDILNQYEAEYHGDPGLRKSCVDEYLKMIRQIPRTGNSNFLTYSHG